MAPKRSGSLLVENKFLPLLLFCVLGALCIAAFTLAYGSTKDFEVVGISTASRTLNQTTAVVLTSIALIVPLTSNLYTPKLVKLYVTHPLIVIGLSVLVLSHLLIMGTSFFPRGHRIFGWLVLGISLNYLLVLTATLPFLYGLSQFLRPSYFLPMLTRQGSQNLRRLNRGRNIEPNSAHFFETVDVVTNIAITGMGRGDRQLVLLSLNALHQLLSESLPSARLEGGWRAGQPFFVPGLAREGQEYLIRKGIWPEAYLLSQMLKVMEVATKRQHEILGELAQQLVTTAQQAFRLGVDEVLELHVMAFNSLMREAIEEKDLRRFQNLSYHYRILAESLHPNPSRMHDAAHHMVHYGGLAARLGLPFGMETMVYDLGELILAVARHSEALAIQLVEGAPGSFLLQSLGEGTQKAKVGWRTLIHLHWEARAEAFHQLAALVQDAYLPDEALHREQVQRTLSENRELHFEFNDRLMRFAFLSPEAESLARRFVLAS